ncbi:MAG TPA: hypothetical protein VEY06_12350 [Flavisolibacter sp.]|nr:hypothetical protein [Flavisolibacter sp.]
MLEKKFLKGITWGHSRGITALLAGAQRCSELHPDVETTYGPKHLNSFVKFEGTKGAQRGLLNFFVILLYYHHGAGKFQKKVSEKDYFKSQHFVLTI